MNKGGIVVGIFMGIVIGVVMGLMLAVMMKSDGNVPGGNAQKPFIAEVRGYGELSFSAPHTYKNMTLFVISRTTPELKPPADYITLAEGLETKKVVLSELENASVQTLQLENLSDKPLFIQVGDVVKGGKQDRTIQASLVIPAHSGKVDVPSLCVEESRWSGNAQFGSSANIAADKNMKLAIQVGAQSEVWANVAEYKEKARQITGESNSKTSSFNEEMDNEKMKQARAEYEKEFGKLLEQYPDAIGVAYVLNGEINSVDLFLSNKLLKKAYPKMLNAFASESVVNPAKGEIKLVSNNAVSDFMKEMEKGKANEQKISGNAVMKLENDAGFCSELKDESDQLMHKQYIKK
ncbi:MAG: hypothetical protein HY811_00220 [Planctomycetes bacterium]|nr:hypothetical protein [Planctomycetota bacterium]